MWDEIKRALQRPASYFVERVVARRTTRFNPLLEVVHVNGRTLLNGKSVNYSFGSLHRIFDDAFEALAIAKRPVERVLMLGLGGGSVLRILEQRGMKPREVVVVEIDPVVIELARAHFALDELPNVNVCCADAALFVGSCDQRFDLVIVDAFVDDVVPHALETREFLGGLARCLDAGGLLLYNRLVDSERARRATDEFALTFRGVFPDAAALAIRTNRLLVVDERSA